MHWNSLLLFRKYALSYMSAECDVLEVGPDIGSWAVRALKGHGVSTLACVAEHLVRRWDTVDLFPNPRLTYIAQGEYDFPIEDNSYDVVVSANVMEHVRKPWVWIRELTRVCRPGGYVVTILPASWPYHEAPVDCWRAYPEGMKALYEDAGLTPLVFGCEVLEDSGLRRRIPGRTQANVRGTSSMPMRVATQVLALIGYPLEAAHDTIAIGRK